MLLDLKVAGGQKGKRTAFNIQTATVDTQQRDGFSVTETDTHTHTHLTGGVSCQVKGVEDCAL